MAKFHKSKVRATFGALLIASLLGGLGLAGSASGSSADFMFLTDQMRFGGEGGAETEPDFFETSVADNGMLKQPFVKEDDKWYQLTFNNYELDMALGSGIGGSNWSDATVELVDELTDLTVDSSGATVSGSEGSVNYGYGTVVVEGIFRLNGSDVGIKHTYELRDTANFLEVTTEITNYSGEDIDNLRLWVGTRDDYVGEDDTPRKTRGNIADGSFSEISNTAESSNAIKIDVSDDDPELSVLFYSTTENTATSIAAYGPFSNAYNQEPSLAATTANGDGSYAISIPFGTVANGEAETLTWFYAAAPTSEIEQIVSDVAAAAAPPAPTVTPEDSAASLSWDAPESDEPISAYRLRYSIDDGANWTVHPTDVTGTPPPREDTISDLTNGTQYLFQVAALTDPDDDGNLVLGSWSSSGSAVIPGAPTAPSIDSLTAGNNKLTLGFSPPSATGGFAVSDYEYSTDNGSTWVSAGQTSSPIVISGLTNGETYQVKIRAKGVRSGIASSVASATPAGSAPDAPTISSVAPAAATLTVAFSAPLDDGGSAIANYKYSTDGVNYESLDPDQTTSPIVITALSSDGTTPLVDGTSYPITLKAVNENGDSVASNEVDATPGAPAPRTERDDDDDDTPAPVVAPTTGGTPVAIPPRAATPPQANLPVTRQGPVLRNGVAPREVRTPEVRVGGVATAVESSVTNPSTLSVRAGTLSLGVQVAEDQGGVSQAADGTTEIGVSKGGSTNLSGSGLRPGSTVQVFLPLQGSNAKELTRIPVGEDGSFNGDASFATEPEDEPLPIGRQVMQMVSVDVDGNEVVVDMTVNVAQSEPTPELNRVDGVIPTMAPGASIATNAGVPEEVTVTAVEEQKLAVVEGDGWSMAVEVGAEDGGVDGSAGGASITLVRDESAQVSGEGFMPGTRADVWLFSEPTLLGTVTIDDEGRFNGEMNIDGAVVSAGEHTLQMQGVGVDGYVRSANMGVVVDDSNVAAAEETAQASMAVIWWSLAGVIVLAAVVGLTIARRRHLF